jgi:predicted Zn-dependent peptidase
MKYSIKKLNNGLTLVLNPLPSRRSAAVSVWVKTGGRYEKKEQAGISHFIEHLVFRGTKNRDALSIKGSIESVGGYLNAFTSEECTCYYAKVPPRHTDIALDVLSDMVLNPLFDASHIRREKAIIKEEIRMYRDMPHHHIHDLLNDIMWPEHPLSTPLAGTYKSVNSMNDKIIKAYHLDHYRPNNIVVSISGKINKINLLRQSKDIFSKAIKVKTPGFKKFKLSQKGPSYNILKKDTEQTHLLLGFHTPKRNSSNRYAISLLSTILGGNMSSRLFEKIREQRGLAYQISTSLSKFDETGVFNIDAGIKNKKVLDALDIMLNELKLIKMQLLDKKELAAAKEFICGQLILQLDNTANNALWIGEKILLKDKALEIEEIVKKIRQVKAEEILHSANEIFKPEKLNLALIGPVSKEKKRLLKMINSFS